jgi:hypothetical protein
VIAVEPGDVMAGQRPPELTLGSFWAHPERVLDQHARNATSGFARTSRTVVDRVVSKLERDR